ncbi:MBL fold metallo-hydrolase [Alkalilimnicola ehrlichii]|uniref:MBL fold metallo-hydrolase n=1 Tax=Alkalilimnicola ehrlichii TaxID=351052 RepID=A0A3E0WMD9_9GAMM|nr:MBL fold metallo-hydrolase [Alkalilimnicola ehrlichii]RFA27775.1 MBL fold metallo-hydrolase [Alkalilimnicola ehrlichii]RFA33579.1 MBL fold metallo-hydrolase [Alkalilimnicola ehrlichii]
MNSDGVNQRSQTRIQRAAFGRVSVFFGEKSGKYPDGNQVLIRGSDTLAAFDTPIVSNYIGAEFDATELVVLGHVHEDHMAGLHRLPNAEVYAPEADVSAARSWEGLAAHFGWESEERIAQALEAFRRDFFYVPRPDAKGYQDGMTWDFGQVTVRAIHMPGHTAGHTVLLVEPEGIAFIGDIDLSGFGPYYGDACSSLADFRRSLARLPDIPAKVWVTSHHRGVYTDREHFLKDLAAFAAKIDEREQRLLALLGESPKTLEQLVEQRLLYPPGFNAGWVTDAETRTISQHLSELLADGRVTMDESGFYRLGG